LQVTNDALKFLGEKNNKIGLFTNVQDLLLLELLLNWAISITNKIFNLKNMFLKFSNSPQKNLTKWWGSTSIQMQLMPKRKMF
jgi:hypothetical protein